MISCLPTFLRPTGTLALPRPDAICPRRTQITRLDSEREDEGEQGWPHMNATKRAFNDSDVLFRIADGARQREESLPQA